ncbi:CRISPR-associated endoribonuclease Cas6 [Bacillus sp. FJAT-47783]|uniref:CRISPR-associated endoribonuclease Cas6 n=1 Tax=Bacillus sp. FJAT-47783 TaxID=2922712 RepID=UPI001FAE6A1A|nr:CRISPR-associated endoribonuclease Cas6 [Bacillus sp. FJAT-47783]
MRLKVQFRPINDSLILPLNYQECLQGLLYSSLNDPTFSSFIHDKGFQKGKRSFKLFTFSRLFGEHVILRKEKKIKYFNTITWHVGAVMSQFIQLLGENFLFRGETIYLKGQPLEIVKVEVEKVEINEQSYLIEMLSPLTVYSTYEQANGTKKTHFFSPFDEVFPIMVENNFYNKYEAFYGTSPETRFVIKPIDVKQKYKVVTSFKGFRITAWQGKFELSSSPEQIRFAYGSGLGSRNSQGFGMFQIIK